ncbi:MAG: xanthine dehydrogenase family protein molybdopterin-binding subunit [Burkholderiaceae bacterium]
MHASNPSETERPRSASPEAGIGARVLRKEDARHLRGAGVFVADMALPGTLEAALVRSPVAHAAIRGIRRPADALVFTAEDLAALAPLLPDHAPPTAQRAPFPVLASGRVRFVGEPVAIALAETRARAEDLAESVEVDFDELPVAIDTRRALAPDAPLLHAGWRGNKVDEFVLDAGWPAGEGPPHHARLSVSREYRMARQSMNPMEGKACLAVLDERLDQLLLYSSTQVPHLVREAVCEVLRLGRNRLRVVAPDVGGGFGYKSIVQAEEILVAWLALKLRRPVRWLEDRREHLIAAANTREQIYRVTAHADARGRVLALEADIDIDAGAYSVYPFTNLLDAGMAVGNMTGPYDIARYRGRARAVATNKPPVAPYRGVARPGACFAIEQLFDALARELGREPWEIRLENLVDVSAMPYTTVTGKTYDSGDYREALRRAVDGIEAAAIRRRQARPADPSRRIGVGVACFVELTGHSPRAAGDWRLPVRPGPEPAHVRMSADGSLEIRIGLQSHGQGMETTMAQVAHEVLGIDLAQITVLHGDTGTSGFSTGTYASRGMVVGAGAVAGACRLLAERLRRLGAALLSCPYEATSLHAAGVAGPQGSLGFDEIARRWHADPASFGPAGAECGSLECGYGYEMPGGQGAFTYGAHAATVEVDIETGTVRLLDYLVVEDCGTAVNPLIVDGQVIGGVVQGIGSALYEETVYDEAGQPRGSTLIDYLLPGAGDVPFVRIDHLVHVSPHTEFGIKGVGEGGAIPSASAVCSAVNDALREFGVELRELPMSPERILGALMNAAHAMKAAAA